MDSRFRGNDGDWGGIPFPDALAGLQTTDPLSVPRRKMLLHFGRTRYQGRGKYASFDVLVPLRQPPEIAPAFPAYLRFSCLSR